MASRPPPQGRVLALLLCPPTVREPGAALAIWCGLTVKLSGRRPGASHDASGSCSRRSQRGGPTPAARWVGDAAALLASAARPLRQCNHCGDSAPAAAQHVRQRSPAPAATQPLRQGVRTAERPGPCGGGPVRRRLGAPQSSTGAALRGSGASGGVGAVGAVQDGTERQRDAPYGSWAHPSGGAPRRVAIAEWPGVYQSAGAACRAGSEAKPQ